MEEKDTFFSFKEERKYCLSTFKKLDLEFAPQKYIHLNEDYLAEFMEDLFFHSIIFSEKNSKK